MGPNELTAINVLLSSIGVVGFCGNLLVVCIYSSRHSHQLHMKTTITALAVADLVVCATVIPLTLHVLAIQGKIESEILCKLYIGISSASTNVSIVLLVVIALERYMTICHKRGKFSERVSLRVILVLVGLELGLAVVASLTFGVERIPPIKARMRLETTNFANESGNFTIPREVLVFYLKLGGQANAMNDGAGNDTALLNTTETVLTAPGRCRLTYKVFSREFIQGLMKAHLIIFALCAMTLTFCYSRIVLFVVTRRHRLSRARRGLRKSSKLASQRRTVAEGHLERLLPRLCAKEARKQSLPTKMFGLNMRAKSVLGQVEVRVEPPTTTDAAEPPGSTNVGGNTPSPEQKMIDKASYSARLEQVKFQYPPGIASNRLSPPISFPTTPSTSTDKDSSASIELDIPSQAYEKPFMVAITRMATGESPRGSPFRWLADAQNLLLASNTRMALMVGVITVLFVVTYLPQFLITHRIIDQQKYVVLYYVYFLNNAMNPAVYSIMNRQFRAVMKRTMRCAWHRLVKCTTKQ